MYRIVLFDIFPSLFPYYMFGFLRNRTTWDLFSNPDIELLS